MYQCARFAYGDGWSEGRLTDILAAAIAEERASTANATRANGSGAAR
jgi:hypothetical protein